MSFIRAKEIPPGSGNWYDYEVKSVWNGGKVRQQVIRYIGKSSEDGRSIVKKGNPIMDAILTPSGASQISHT